MSTYLEYYGAFRWLYAAWFSEMFPTAEGNIFPTWRHFSVHQECIIKEEKRVSNAVDAMCNMCAESHAPRIQILTN